MRDHADAGRLDRQEFFHLIGREARDRNDQVAAARGLSSLFRKARTKFGRGVFASDDEEIVKSGHGPARGCVHALIQCMEQIALRSAAQNPPGSVPG